MSVWHVQPLIADGKVYAGNEDGVVTVFAKSATKRVLGENQLDSAIYSSPIVANGILYIADRSRLYAIAGE